MANWIAGHTDRFDAIVTHASLWALGQFGSTTDASWYWQREMSEEMAAANSPHLSADAITSPMLVIHGDKDYRVPIGEELRLGGISRLGPSPTTANCRTSSCTSPTRTTGRSRRNMRRSGTKPCWLSWLITCWAILGNPRHPALIHR